MATPSFLQHNQLLNALVLDRASTEDLGRVDVVWMYPQAHRVLGFICKPSALSPKRIAFNLPQIHTLNTTQPKTVWVQAKGTETDIEQVRQLQTLIGHTVWTESGQVLGKVVDCTFNLRTGEIQDYAVALKGLRGMVADPFVLKPAAILSFGSKRLLVTPSVAQSMTDQEDRIKQTLGELKQEYRQVREELKSFSSQAQTLFQKASTKVQSKVQRVGTQVGAKAQQWAQEALDTAHSTTQNLQETWQEEWPKQGENGRDRAQNFVDPADFSDFDDRTASPKPTDAASPTQAPRPTTPPQPRPQPPPPVQPQHPDRSPADRIIYPPHITDDFGEEGEETAAWAGADWEEAVWEQDPEPYLAPEPETEIWDQWSLDSAPSSVPPTGSNPAPGSAARSAPGATSPVPPRPPQIPTPPNPPPETLDLDGDPWL